MYTSTTNGKLNGRKSITDTEKVGNIKSGRRKQSYRKCKPSITSNAICRTHGIKKTTFYLQHGRKPRLEFTNIVKDGKPYLSDWSELSISAPKRPKKPIYEGRDADSEITNHIVIARTKVDVIARTKFEEKQQTEGPKSPK